MYPILDLARHKQDLHWYLRSLEEVVVRALASVSGLQVRTAGMGAPMRRASGLLQCARCRFGLGTGMLQHLCCPHPGPCLQP